MNPYDTPGYLLVNRNECDYHLPVEAVQDILHSYDWPTDTE